MCVHVRAHVRERERERITSCQSQTGKKVKKQSDDDLTFVSCSRVETPSEFLAQWINMLTFCCNFTHHTQEIKTSGLEFHPPALI